MRISRLALTGWKNFAAAELRPLDRTLLIGPNAAGKTNLLDALRFLRDLADPVGGGLQAAVARRQGVAALACLAGAAPERAGAPGEANAAVGAPVALEIALSAPGQPGWGYALAFAADAETGARILRETVTLGDTALLSRPDAADAADPARLTQTALEQTALNAGFRPLAGFLHSLAEVPAADGPALAARIAACPPRRRTARLARMSAALRLAVPQFDRLALAGSAAGPRLTARYRHWPADHPGQDHASFSAGTLRLLALLWELQDPGGPLLIEEPERALPPAVAAELPRLIRNATRPRGRRPGRQVFIATHSPDLLADPTLGLDEVVLVRPGPGGTDLVPATDLPGAAERLAAGLPLAEILWPALRPPHAERLGRLALD